MSLFKEQKNVPIERLKPAKYNPPRRMSKDSCRKLMKAMQDLDGLVYPIIVDNENNIIEGHRRWASAKHLGWKTVDVMKLANGHDRNLIYALINDTGKGLTANDKIGVYLIEPNAVTVAMRGRIQRAIDEIGLDIIKRIYKEGYSLEPVIAARRVANYCGMDGEFRKIVLWFLKHTDMIRLATEAIRYDVAPAVIRKAIESNKRLKYTLE